MNVLNDLTQNLKQLTEKVDENSGLIENTENINKSYFHAVGTDQPVSCEQIRALLQEEEANRQSTFAEYAWNILKQSITEHPDKRWKIKNFNVVEISPITD